MTDDEKAVIAAEYINKAGKRVVEDRPQPDTNLIDNHVRDYRRFSEKEIAPAMEEVVNQHEEVKAAEATAAKPAEPTKPEIKLEEKETKESDLGFGKDKGHSYGAHKEEHKELVQNKIY